MVPVPTVGGGEALIRITHAGVCRTELHFLSGLLNLGIAPLTLGHEIVGEVVLTGAAVGTAQPGDRVIVNYYGTCGRCIWCRTGQQNLCSHVVAQLGFTVDGGYAEFVKARADMLVPLPAHLDAAEACTLGCSAATALHAARRIAPVQLGDTVLIYGAGGVGYALVQVCKLSGARVLVVGRSQRKLELAQQLGADAVIHAARNPWRRRSDASLATSGWTSSSSWWARGKSWISPRRACANAGAWCLSATPQISSLRTRCCW
jgi:propanol-preferring alcohol dehydrogenase